MFCRPGRDFFADSSWSRIFCHNYSTVIVIFITTILYRYRPLVAPETKILCIVGMQISLEKISAISFVKFFTSNCNDEILKQDNF